VIKKNAENIETYNDLTTDTQRTLNLKTNVIPVTIGAAATISAPFRKYINNVPGKHDIKGYRTAIFGTAHLFRKELMSKQKMFFMDRNITCAVYTYCNHGTSVTLYTLHTWFFPGI
jgi:hypothetical protein